MTKIINSGIGKIKYGEIHFYHPFKFETSLPFDKLCENIQKSPIIYSEKYQEKILNSVGFSLSQIVEKIRNQFPGDEVPIIRMDDFNKYRTVNSVPSNIDSNDLRLEFESTDSSFKINFVHTELEALEQRILRLHQEYEFSSRIYGNNFTSLQERFLLLPFKIELENKIQVWLHAILYVFANNMGILKLELPLIDSDITHLKSNNPDLFVRKISNKWQVKNFSSNTLLSNLPNIYLSSLAEDIQVDYIKFKDIIRHIVLIDFEGMPKQINSISNDVQEDLFRIISAPVPERQDSSYMKDAKDYLQKYSWGGHNIKYIVKTTGGCLSFIDQTILNNISEEYKNQYNTNASYTGKNSNVYNTFARDMHLNAEFALLVIILKKINDNNDYYQKVTNLKQISKIKKEYNQNLIFLAELQESCYGSVSEQTIEFEKMMFLYIKPEITHSKLTAIDNILKDAEQEKNENFQTFLSIGALILSLIFGLPSIYEALKIIRTVCIFIPQNIPFFTIENSSILFWLLINIFIVVKLFKRNFTIR